MMRYLLLLGLLITAVVVPTRGMPGAQASDAASARAPAPADSAAAALARGRALRVDRILGRDSTGGPDLGRWLVATGNDPERAAAQIRRAVALARDGNRARALVVLDSAAATVPWFEDWVHLIAAQLSAAAGDTAEVRRRLAMSEPELVAERGWRLRMDAARKAGDNLAARRAALDAARSARTADRRAIAWAVVGDLRAEGGDSARAREAYRTAMASEGSVGAVDGARGLSRLGPTPDDWRVIATVYARHGNQARAIEGFQKWLDAGIGEPAERARVRLQLGRAQFDAGRYTEAERALDALARDSVSPRFASEAMFLLARARYRQGRSADGQATFLELSRRFPDQDATARGLYMLADLKHDDLELADARTYYRRAVDAAPTLNEAGLALMRLGGLAFLEGDHEAAARIYEEYRTAHPNGRRWAQATYWGARAYASLGRQQDMERLVRELRAADPVSYYGARAAELMNADVLEGVPLEPSPAREPAADSQVAAGVRRVDLLEALERPEDVAVEVERLRRHFERRDGGDYALAEALNERGYTLTGINMGWEIRRREGAWNPRLLRIVYPFPFRELVLTESRRRGLDPFLVAGLIRRESAFNPGVVSPAGAIGLMQIMPETGRGLASGAGLRGYTPDVLKDPDVNVQLGVRYLDELMRRFGADHLPTVLSAYNAGPNRAVRWRSLPEHADPELFTERIPYAETRDYVRHVLFHRALYRSLYPDAGPRPAEDR